MCIVSHSNKFIFLKSRKTAGTSLSVPFAEICDNEDIVALSKDVINETGLERKNVTRSLVDMSAYAIARHCYYLIKNINHLGSMETLLPTFQQHMTASEIKEAVGERVWDSYYKITIERNPYDRLVSFYNWRKYRFNLDITFNDFAKAVFSNEPNLRKYTYGFSNRPFYLDRNKNICVNKVIFFEDIQNGLEEVFSELGLDRGRVQIPNFKCGIRKERSYRSLYTDELKEKAKKAFSLEERLFGYEF